MTQNAVKGKIKNSEWAGFASCPFLSLPVTQQAKRGESVGGAALFLQKTHGMVLTKRSDTP